MSVMNPPREKMIEFLQANAARTIVEDTGMSILYAKPDGLWESLYTFPGGEIPEGDPIEEAIFRFDGEGLHGEGILARGMGQMRGEGAGFIG
jgi:hypothetical protein